MKWDWHVILHVGWLGYWWHVRWLGDWWLGYWWHVRK
jgi:hypothetical protein